MNNKSFKHIPFAKSSKDNQINDLIKEVNKLKKNYKEIIEKLGHSEETTNSNIKLIFDGIFLYEEHKKLFSLKTNIYQSDFTPILFTSKKSKIRIEKLDGIINLIKNKESFFSLEGLGSETDCSNTNKILNIQGNINIFNLDSGHMYSGLIISEKNGNINYILSNRPCIPLSVEFKGYIQINLLIN